MTLKVSRVDLWTVSIDDRAGGSADKLEPLTNAGISFRALSATGIGSKFVSYVALDTAEDAAKAVSLLKGLS